MSILLRPGRKRGCNHAKHDWRELDWGLFDKTGLTDTPCVVCARCGKWRSILEGCYTKLMRKAFAAPSPYWSKDRLGGKTISLFRVES